VGYGVRIMASSIVLLKAEGTHPASEGVLSRVARVHALRSMADLGPITSAPPDIILLDIQMPGLDGQEVLQKLCSVKNAPLIMVFSSSEQPQQLLGRLDRLGAFKRKAKSRLPTVAHILKVLGVSQEALARMLKVSTRTAFRWAQGARHKPRRDLDQLGRLVMLLEETLPGLNAIKSYLNHANPGLDGDTPLNALSRGEFESISADLIALQEGVYD